MKQATLLFLLDNNRILLAMKKRGFGVGRWNGVGGKPHKNEAIEKTARRECQEEIRVVPKEIKEIATLNFYFPENKKEWNQQVIVFICRTWKGKPMETEEMSPQWFAISGIPYDKMWSDDKYWLPKVIEGEYVKADFYFDDNDNLLKYNI
ncbi:8-oxo-dGTP diphosphatase [Patescibacteria group bacterium]|nr:8-oxo-dGTP diphosphatase [Patescibacteria group bacterium]